MKSISLLIISCIVITCNSIAQNTFTDPRDEQVYQIVTIGKKKWFAENLAFKPSSGNYWAYGNNISNVAIYGYLYDWPTAKDVCPSGWHLPTDAEWKNLETNIGMSQSKADDIEWRGTDEGGKLKELGSNHWRMNKAGATNSSGFTALPGGSRDHFDGNFYSIGYDGYWWSATEGITTHAWSRKVDNKNSNIYRGISNKKRGFSVRCVRD